MPDPILSVLVGIPAYGGLARAEQTAMWFELGHAFATAEDRFRFAGIKLIDSQPIDRVRNLLIAEARQRQVDWLLMIDTDVWIDGTDEEPAGYQLLRMISEADRRGAAIVGAHVQRRGGEGLMTYDRSVSTGRLIPVNPMPNLYAVDAIGTSVFAMALAGLPEGVEFRFARFSPRRSWRGTRDGVCPCHCVFMAASRQPSTQWGSDRSNIPTRITATGPWRWRCSIRR